MLKAYKDLKDEKQIKELAEQVFGPDKDDKQDKYVNAIYSTDSPPLVMSDMLVEEGEWRQMIAVVRVDDLFRVKRTLAKSIFLVPTSEIAFKNGSRLEKMAILIVHMQCRGSGSKRFVDVFNDYGAIYQPFPESV